MIPRPRRSADDVKKDLRRTVEHRRETRARISELSRQITLASREAQSDERRIDQLLAELSALHRAEIEAAADRLVRP